MTKINVLVGYSIEAISSSGTRKDASVWFDCNGLQVEVVLPRPIVKAIAFPGVVRAISQFGRGKGEPRGEP